MVLDLETDVIIQEQHLPHVDSFLLLFVLRSLFLIARLLHVVHIASSDDLTVFFEF